MTPEIEARLRAAKRLFVDVDDTLIRHLTNEAKSGIFVVEGYEPNYLVTNAIWRFILRPPIPLDKITDREVVVWSSGGEDYAKKMTERVVSGFAPAITTSFASKYRAVPEDGDLFIDDDPLPSFASATIHPREFE